MYKIGTYYIAWKCYTCFFLSLTSSFLPKKLKSRAMVVKLANVPSRRGFWFEDYLRIFFTFERHSTERISKVLISKIWIYLKKKKIQELLEEKYILKTSFNKSAYKYSILPQWIQGHLYGGGDGPPYWLYILNLNILKKISKLHENFWNTHCIASYYYIIIIIISLQ